MTNDSNTTEKKREYTPRKAKLPSVAPLGTRRIVSALAELAGPASRERLASRLGVQLTGHMASSLGAALLYGFIEVGEGDKLVTTARGLAFLGEDEAAAKDAEREAVMSTGFGSVIKRLVTRKADAEIVAVRLQEDQGLLQGPATERAKVLVKAAGDAGLVANERFDAAAIEDTIAVIGEPTITATAKAPSAAATAAKRNTAPPVERPANTSEAARKEGRTREKPDVPFEPGATSLQVVLQIDASKLGAKEIAAIVRELRGSATVSTSGS